MMQKSVLVLKSNFTLAQGAEGGPQMLMTMGGSEGAGAGGPKPNTSMRNYWNSMRRGPKLMDRLKGAAGFVGKPLAVLGGAFAGMDALANASQSGSLTGALNAPTGALMTYQGLNPASYMSMPPTYRGPAPSRIRTETADIGTATPLELQEQQTAEVEGTTDIHDDHTVDEAGTHSKPKTFTPPHPLETPETAPAPAPVHTPAPTKQTGLGGIVAAAEETPPPQSMVDSSLANQQVKPDANVDAAVGAYNNLNQRGKIDENSNWAFDVLDNTSVLTPEQIEQYRQQGLPGEEINQNYYGVDEDWGEEDDDDPWAVKGFIPAFMEVYGDLLKGMSPHDVGIFASEVFLKMR